MKGAPATHHDRSHRLLLAVQQIHRNQHRRTILVFLRDQLSQLISHLISPQNQRAIHLRGLHPPYILILIHFVFSC